MLDYTLASVNFFFFIFLAILHANWLSGRSRFAGLITPTDGNDRMLFRPSPLLLVFLCIISVISATLNLGWVGLLPFGPYRQLCGYGIAVIGTLLLLRAIGDFRYIGFSKRHSNSRFARADSTLISPLCLLFSLTHFAVL